MSFVLPTTSDARAFTRSTSFRATVRCLTIAPRGRRARVAALLHRHQPEHAVVLEPLRAFDERSQVEAVGARRLWRLHAELEPRHLTRSDVRRGLDRDAVVARPCGVRRSEPAVAAQRRGTILTGL